MVTTRSATRATAGAVPLASQVNVTIERISLAGADETDRYPPLDARERSVYEGYNFNRIEIGAGANTQLGDRNSTEHINGHAYRSMTVTRSQVHCGDFHSTYKVLCLHSCRKCVAQLLCVAVIALLLSQCLTYLGALFASHILSPVLRFAIHVCIRLGLSMKRLALFITATVSPIILVPIVGILCGAVILFRKKMSPTLKTVHGRACALLEHRYLPEGWEIKPMVFIDKYLVGILFMNELESVEETIVE